MANDLDLEPIEFIIIEWLDGGLGELKPTVWQHARTVDNKKITFWGTIGSMRNITSIEKQELPFIIEVFGAEENQKYKHKYGSDISVSEGCKLSVNPLPALHVRLIIDGNRTDQ
jgi:hypothetical protein